MLEEYRHVHYCKRCKAMLITWNEDVIELRKEMQYFAHDGFLETGDATTINTKKTNRITCSGCGLKVSHYVAIEKSVFLQILKYSYRDANSPDNLFKINLKSREGQKSMIPPTLQEIKEAMVEELI